MHNPQKYREYIEYFGIKDEKTNSSVKVPFTGNNSMTNYVGEINMKHENKQEENTQEKMITVEIADVTGHQTLMLKPQETIEVIENNSDKWIYVNNQLIEHQHVPEIDWNQAESVRILPGLVGGITNQSC